MAQAAQAEQARPVQTIKISSKRQITIPAKWYREKQFTDYALVELTDEGILIKPIEVDREDVTMNILRQLVAEGYSGDELIDRYEELCNKVVPIEKPTASELKQLEEVTPKGRSVGEFMREMLEKYSAELEEMSALEYEDDEERELVRSVVEGLVDYIQGNTVDFDDMIVQGRRFVAERSEQRTDHE